MRRSNQGLRAAQDIGRYAYVATCVLVLILCATNAQALGNGNADVSIGSKSERAGMPLLHFELPYALKARIDGLYSRTRYAIDALAYNRWLSPGPAVQRDSLLESRVSISREIWDGVEIEVAWATQSPFSVRSIPSPDRQTVGAFIRFTR